MTLVSAAGQLLLSVFELVMNILSFLRVGAFALAHAALSHAIMTLADAVEQPIAWLLVVLTGNAFSLVLEGLVVFVQTTRRCYSSSSSASCGPAAGSSGRFGYRRRHGVRWVDGRIPGRVNAAMPGLQPPKADWVNIADIGHASAPLTHAMSHKHESLLRTIFQDPISGNIHWREVNPSSAIWAPLSSPHTGRYRVVLNGHEGFLHHPHHSNVLGRQDVKHLREFLAHARVTPSLYA